MESETSKTVTLPLTFYSVNSARLATNDLRMCFSVLYHVFINTKLARPFGAFKDIQIFQSAKLELHHHANFYRFLVNSCVVWDVREL